MSVHIKASERLRHRHIHHQGCRTQFCLDLGSFMSLYVEIAFFFTRVRLYRCIYCASVDRHFSHDLTPNCTPKMFIRFLSSKIQTKLWRQHRVSPFFAFQTVMRGILFTTVPDTLNSRFNWIAHELNRMRNWFQGGWGNSTASGGMQPGDSPIAPHR